MLLNIFDHRGFVNTVHIRLFSNIINRNLKIREVSWQQKTGLTEIRRCIRAKLEQSQSSDVRLYLKYKSYDNRRFVFFYIRIISLTFYYMYI